MTIELLKNEDRSLWDEYVRKSAFSACYHLTAWKDVIEGSFGQKTYYLVSKTQGQVTGILPLAHLKSFLFGNFMVSLPYFNYGGICADSKDIHEELLNKAVEIALAGKASHIELRQGPDSSSNLPARTEKVSMRLSLPKDRAELWNSFSAKLRSQVRRPEKEGMYAEVGKEEQLDSFYEVFSTNMRDLGTPVYSKDFFRNILSTFPGTAWICTVYTKFGDPAASGFLLGFKDTMEIPWASSLRSYNHYSPNMLLYWSVLTFAAEKGYGIFDFGRSTRGVGTYRFKEQWGARPVQLHWNYWMKNGGPLPELNPHNPKYRTAIQVWKNLPVMVTRILGPGIVKNLP